MLPVKVGDPPWRTYFCSRIHCVLKFLNIELMRYLIVSLLGLFVLPLMAQDIRPLKGFRPTEPYDNVAVIPVYSDGETSSFVIYIKQGVGLHYHA